MGIWELLVVALGLSMDACSVAVTNGICEKKRLLRAALEEALIFGGFQGLMLNLGYMLGFSFIEYIRALDHYIALILLCFIGGKMVYEGIQARSADCTVVRTVSFGRLILQGVATSIDAFAVGISFAAMEASIIASSAIVAGVTFMCCFTAFLVGKHLGSRFNNKSEIFGGIILILTGLKIFIEHMYYNI